MAYIPSQELQRPARAWHSRRQATCKPLLRPICQDEQLRQAVICEAASQREARGAWRERRSDGPGNRLRAPKPHKPPQAPAEPEEPPEVPEVGWLWQVGEKKEKGSKPEQVSAQTTVADLRQDRISAKKSLGQNFLTDDGILKDIVKAAGVKKGDLVLEVGPGTGNLTKHLISAGAHVTAVEKDDTLWARLAHTYAQTSALKLIHDDVLRMDVIQALQEMQAQGAVTEPEATPTSSNRHQPSSSQQQSAQSAPPPTAPQSKRKVKVVANLPYNITSDFLKKLLPAGDLVSELHIMLQEEAGVRLVKSAPGDRDYRAMSLRVNLYSKAVYRFMISKAKYFPVPGVDGALITFKLIPPSARMSVPSERGFFRAVEKAFNERRKMLRNSLQPLYSAQQVEASLADAGLSLTARAQDLDVKQWTSLYRTMHAKALEDDELKRQEQQQLPSMDDAEEQSLPSQ